MYSWSKDWPTLTEIFFGKGNGPQGKLNGMTATPPKGAIKKASTKKTPAKAKTAKKSKD
tara:strand:+ start:316 stop:492 length:177 start_codon:yes stop_codon:yes gene_type:complete